MRKFQVEQVEDVFKNIFEYKYILTHYYSCELIKSETNKHLDKYKQCADYLDKDFLKQLSGNLKNFLKDISQFDQINNKGILQFDKINNEIDNIWQGLNKIKAGIIFDCLQLPPLPPQKPLEKPQLNSLIRDFMNITFSITHNNNYFKKYYQQDYEEYFIKTRKEIPDIDLYRESAFKFKNFHNKSILEYFKYHKESKKKEKNLIKIYKKNLNKLH